MALQFEVNEVPAGLEDHYTQTEGGKFRLNVNGVVPESEYEAVKAKNKEFRDSNTNLLKTNKSLSSFEQLFGGVQNVTPDALQHKIDELAAKRADEMVSSMKSKYDLEAKELRDGLSTSTQRLSKLLIGDAIRSAGSTTGMATSAYDDVLRRAEDSFEVRDGAVQFKGSTLDSEGKPYTVTTWMSELAKSATHLFNQSQGTGATRNTKTIAQNTDKRSSSDLIMSGLNKMTKGGTKRLS